MAERQISSEQVRELSGGSSKRSEETEGVSRGTSVEGKPRFHYLKKLFMPWKWKKKKRSEKFRSISSVLERKMSTRMSKDQLKEMGLIPPSHSGAQDSSILLSTENPCYDEAEPDSSTAAVEELDESWVTQVGVIPPPAMFSPPHPSSASLVSVMKVGAGLDLSDPTLSEKIGGFSPDEKAEKDITENKELEKQEVIEAINPLLSRDSPRLAESERAEARTEQQNKLILQVPSPQLGGGDEAPRETVASLKRKLSSQCPDISSLPPRPPLREKPAKVCCQTSQEEWRDRRERIGRSLERRLSTRPSAEELRDRNLIPKLTREEKEDIKRRISVKLERRLSIRPTEVDLKNRNILKAESSEQSRQKQEQTKTILQRKLSIRPSVSELRRRKILKFSEYIEVKYFLDLSQDL